MTAFIVGAMLIATVLVMAVSAAGMDRKYYDDMPRMVYEFDAATDTGIYINDGPTVRIYGEVDAIYPTQSYTEALDFIYPDPVDAFDPGVIGEDSVTFNPAYMYNVASVDGTNSLEDDMKVFFRVFYEPGYDHVVDDLMVNNIVDMQRRDITMPEGALVTETTFMLVKDNYNSGHSGVPIIGAADYTKFTMPVNSDDSYDGTPGMTVIETVDLLDAEGDGLLGAGELTDGAIEVGIEHIEVEPSVPVRFMDHEVEFVGSDGVFAYFDIKYIGNMDEEASADTQIAVPLYNQTVYVERYNTGQSATNPAYRWFISVGAVNCAEWCTFTVGRHLAAGETFYVDGVRYDMPAIYVTDDDKFKYITLQSPLPKCTDECECDMWIEDGYDLNQVDYSHVSNQWLARLLPNVPVWVLPPFDVGHTMIDDIDLAKFDTGVTEPDWEICTEAGDIINGEKPALGFCYVDEAEEYRFDSSLAERHARKDGVELWNWWSVFTKPYQYTELVLPDDEKPSDTYVANDPCMPTPNCADGNEYLITTSFIAPNSEAEERTLLSKSDRECHDIIDRAAEIAKLGDSRRDAYLNMPRMVFEYNAVDTEDLFVNDDGMGNATVRVYGEAGALYPTQSMTGAVDFIYPDAVDPFDPGVIAKDSVTFNPAYIDNEYANAEYPDANTIRVDGGDSDEKVFLRLFYEPEYGHAEDYVMSDYYSSILPVSMAQGALVTETTYMLLWDNGATGHAGLPKLGGTTGTEATRFMLPVASNDPAIPGMDDGDMVDLVYAEAGSIITAGTIEVEQSYTGVDNRLGISGEASFMDHFIRVTSFEDGGSGEIDKVTLDVGYCGNMNREVPSTETGILMEEGKKFYFSRINGHLDATTNPAYRWYIEVTDVNYAEGQLGHAYVSFKLGRCLVAGETFYVDGVRYDMPAIYVAEDNGVDKFKYITFQSPIPKCPDLWAPYTDSGKDWSHVTSQWLANIQESGYEDIHNVWLLPPFNEPHTMIDDIGILKVSCGVDDRTIDSKAGNILDTVDPLKFYYIAEKEEPRFDSSLAERLNSDESTEIWNWWSIFTKPYQYTELVLPDQETATTADGNEFLITTSFIAPNCEDEERDVLCKSDEEVHDIIDRASTLVEDCKGDFDGNGERDLDDFIDFAEAYGTSVGDAAYNSAGDFDDSGTIDLDDFIDFADVYGEPCNP